MNMVPIERPDVIEYQDFPNDAETKVKWGPTVPRGLTFHSVQIYLFIALASIILSYLFQTRIGCSTVAAMTAFTFGAAFTVYFADSAKKLFLARVSQDPRLAGKNFIPMGADRFRIARFRSLTVSSKEALYYSVSVTVAFMVLAFCLNPAVSKFLRPTYLTARTALSIFVVIGASLAIVVTYYFLIRDKIPCNAKQLRTLVAIVFSNWFVRDQRSEIPYLPALTLGNWLSRLKLVFIPVFLIILGFTWLSYYAPVIPAFASERVLSDLVLSHPANLGEKYKDADRLLLPGQEFTNEEAATVEPFPREFVEEYSMEARLAALRQTVEVKCNPVGWISALPTFAYYRPIYAVGSVVTSVIAVVMTCFSFMAMIFISMILLDSWFQRRVIALSVALSESNHWDAVTEAMVTSNDRYERESIFIGHINE